MSARLMEIQTVTPAMVRTAVRRALEGGLDPEAIAEFLASIDWSGLERARPQVRETLGEMEAWATAFTEGELTRTQYATRLLGLLPQAEGRKQRLALGIS